MNNVKILEAKPEDAKGMQQVYYQTWLDTYPNKKWGITIEDIEQVYKDKLTKRGILEFQKKLANPKPELKRFVAKINKKIIGICNIITGEDYNKLSTIYILPKYQGRGIGRMFWNECTKYLNYENETFLNVAEYNTGAIEFYKKLGFVKKGKRFFDKKYTMKSGAIMPEIKMVLKKNIQKNISSIENSINQKTAIIIHGWDCDTNIGWLKWINNELIKKGYRVIMPQMPNPKYPEIKPWVDKLKSYDKYIDENTLLIGYSIGCQTIIRYLEQSNKKVNKCIFVAGWTNIKKRAYLVYPHLEKELRAMIMPWITTKIHLENVKNKMKSSTAIFSTNDVYVPLSETRIFGKKLGSKIIIQQNKAHFQESKFDKIPVLLKEIQ